MEHIIKKAEFAELEHKGGQHQTYQEGCYECHKEDRLIQARKLVASNIPRGYDNEGYPTLT